VTERSQFAVVSLAALGMVISAYLSWVHLSGTFALCVGVGGCEAVQSAATRRSAPCLSR
jgi:hypothetical protein